MTTLELSNKLALNLINFVLRRKVSKKVVEKPQPVTYETYNEYKGDVMDYDGMGNYGRFPCKPSNYLCEFKLHHFITNNNLFNCCRCLLHTL